MKHQISVLLGLLCLFVICAETIAEETPGYCICPSKIVEDTSDAAGEEEAEVAEIKIPTEEEAPLVFSQSRTLKGCQCLQPLYGTAEVSAKPNEKSEKDLFTMKRKCQNGLMDGVCGDYCRLLDEVERIYPLCTHVSRTGNRTLPDELKDIFEEIVSCDNIAATRLIAHDLAYRCLDQAKGILEDVIQEIPSSVLSPLEEEFKKGSQSKSLFYQSIIDEAARWAPAKIACYDTTALKYNESGKEVVSTGMLVKLTATGCDTESNADYVVCEQKSLPVKGADDRYLPLHVERDSIPESLLKFLKQGTTPEDFWIKVLLSKDTLRGRYQSRCRVSVY